MKAVRLHRFGGPEVLQIDEIPVPERGDGEVLVKVRGASINPVDYKIRRGGYPRAKPEDLPITLGRDLAGTVTSSSLAEFAPGDEVFCHLEWNHGAQADYAIASRRGLAFKPRSVDFAVAAAVPLAATTAWQGLFTHGDLRQGQHVLIHGGSGGVGGFAVQLAKAFGARVTATASGDGVPLAEAYGADQVIDYQHAAFEQQARDVDLVFDLIGGDTQTRSWQVLKPGGALISTVQEPDQERRAEYGARALRYAVEPNADQLAQIAALIDDGKIRVMVAEIFALNKVAEAHRLLERAHPQGKLVLLP